MKPLFWIASSYKDLDKLPDTVQNSFGFALYLAQCGERPESAKPLKGFGGAGVLEVVANHDGDTYRAVYTVRFAEVVYVLHCFQKKSKSGIATPKQEIDLVKSRLKIRQMARETEETLVTPSSGNVYADLGMPDAEEMLAKAKLVRAIGHTIREKKLTQVAAAKLMGIDQPKVSDLLKGQFRGYSSDRLMQFLTLLGQDVVIFIAPKPASELGPGHVSISLSFGL